MENRRVEPVGHAKPGFPINTLSFVRLHAENVGGTAIYLERLTREEGNSGVVRSLGIAAVIALTEAVANNLH